MRKKEVLLVSKRRFKTIVEVVKFFENLPDIKKVPGSIRGLWQSAIDHLHERIPENLEGFGHIPEQQNYALAGVYRRGKKYYADYMPCYDGGYKKVEIRSK